MKAHTLSLLVGLFSLKTIANAQEKRFEYIIKRNGDVVGNIHFTHGIAGNRTVLTMESEVNTRFIFNIKVDKKTRANGNNYTVYKGNKTETLNNYPIRYNMLSVYISEPVNITKVYSDNFQQQIDILKIADHHYKIKFPDGNYNEYFYTDGVCSKIEIHHSLYSASIELSS